MINALVSIVIPTYNRASDLKRALNSVKQQTYENWECLVIDNRYRGREGRVGGIRGC